LVRPPAARGRDVGVFLAAARARLVAAAALLVDGRPRAGLGGFLRSSAFLVAFGDVLGLALLLVGVLVLVSSGHLATPLRPSVGTGAHEGRQEFRAEAISRRDCAVGRRRPLPRASA